MRLANDYLSLYSLNSRLATTGMFCLYDKPAPLDLSDMTPLIVSYRGASNGVPVYASSPQSTFFFSFLLFSCLFLLISLIPRRFEWRTSLLRLLALE